MPIDWSPLVDLIRSHNTILLTTHVRPDADGLGSQLALADALTAMGKTVRVVLPLFYGKGCLGCHGEPKNEKDISGYLKDGGKEGDLGGAISVKLAVK